MPRRTLPCSAAVVLCCCFTLLTPVGASRSRARQTPAAAPVTEVPDLVPVNVHVIDRAGKPVTDLTQADFTVTENGAPQQIRHFSTQNLVAGTAPANGGLVLRTRMVLSPQNHRIFVIVLGRGRLDDTSPVLAGVTAFVRKLLPQDMVAVFAHNRAVPFTTDHEAVAQALERCKKSHVDVDVQLDADMGPLGKAALYGTKGIPRKSQAKIDAMLYGPGSKTPAYLAVDAFDEKTFRDLSLDDFMFSSAQTLQDRANLQGLLEYLRRYEGEKHLLLLTEKGLDKAEAMTTDQFGRALAEVANDARTAIHTARVGGVSMAASGNEMDAHQRLAEASKELRAIAELSGGTSITLERAGLPLDRLDEMTRTGYLIGYKAPAAWDGSYRNIVVSVKRPDVTVLYRRGYHRTPGATGFDRRGQVTADRLMAAGGFRREVADIKIKAKATRPRGEDNVLSIDGKIELDKVVLLSADGKRSATLAIGVFCSDSSGWGVGTHTTTLPVALTEEEFARYKKDGLPYSLQFPLHRGTSGVRVVVYDFLGDLTGMTDTKIF